MFMKSTVSIGKEQGTSLIHSSSIARTRIVGGFEALTAEALREFRAEEDRQLAEKDCEIENLRSQIAGRQSENSRFKELEARLERLEARSRASALGGETP